MCVEKLPAGIPVHHSVSEHHTPHTHAHAHTHAHTQFSSKSSSDFRGQISLMSHTETDATRGPQLTVISSLVCIRSFKGHPATAAGISRPVTAHPEGCYCTLPPPHKHFPLC